MGSTYLDIKLLASMGAVAFLVACNTEQRTAPPDPPVEPQIESLESTSETVHPGDSVQLAVVAGPADGETSAGDAGEASTQSQRLNHDAGSDGARDTTNVTDRDASTRDTSSEPSEDTGRVSDTGSAPGASDASIGTDDAGGMFDDAASGSDDDGNDNADTPEPPSGDVPADWTVDWAVDGDDWSIAGDGATAQLQAPDRYETTATVEVTVTTPDDLEASAEISITTGSNTAPAIVTTTARPNPVEPGGDVQATLEASDPNGDELSYDWRISDPWEIASTEGTEATIQAPDRDGVFANLQVEVRDGYDGQTASTIRLETRTNTPPNLSSVTASPPQVEPGGTLQLEASATDAESDNLSYTWTIPSDWSASSTSGEQIEVTAPNTYGVTSTARVTVEDPRGLTASGNVVISTRENLGPSITSLTADPSSVERGGVIELELTADDPDDDEISYTWTVQKRQTWTLQNVKDNRAELQSPNQPGVQTKVEVTVEDEAEKTATASTIVSTQPNLPPSVSSVSANPQSLRPNNTSTVTVQGSDPDGDSLSYQWSATGNWSVSGSGDSATVTAPSSYGANGTITVEVRDGFGGKATGNTTLSTQDNDSPTIASISANPPEVDPQGTTRLTVNASDPNGDDLSYQWSVPSNWTDATGSSAPSNQLVLKAPQTYGDKSVVQVTVSDGEGGSAQASAVVSTASNRDPVLSALTANPQAVEPKGSVTVQATASDPNGDSLSYSWQVPQNWNQSGSGDQITVTAPDSYGESGLVKVTVEDGNGGTATGSILVKTDRNQSPIISNLTANPVVVSPGGTSTVRVTASDPNGDSLSYAWDVPQGWSQKGSGREIEVTAPNKASASATITVTVSDGKGGSSESAVVLQTITNRAPTIQSLTANPQTIEPGNQTTIQASVSDPENDSLTYRWTVPQGWKGSSNQDTLTLTAPRAYDKQYRVGLEVSDGFNTVTGGVLISTVRNQDPEVNSLTIQPDPVDAGARAKAEVKASDPLGDSLDYTWSLSNNNWSVVGSGASVELQSPSNTNSQTQVTVTVKDSYGGETSSTKQANAKARLYAFNAHTFTACGSSGRSGPSLSSCRNSYDTSWDSNSSYYSMDQRGYQEWTVPEDGTYKVKVAGAEGGPSDDRSPGRGNVVSLTHTFDRGDVLTILVGQRGQTGDDREGSGGGGGSFVVETNNYASADESDIIAVAGGGGGGGDNNSGAKHGRSGECGGDGENHPGSGACNGRGGTSEYGNVGGGGGGGFRDGGENANGRNADGGQSFRNGAVGGNSGSNMPGGFGGGGGGSSNCGYGGGGGGYSGGGGGEWRNGCGGVGGGGGSYLTDSGNNRNADAGSNNGDGYVRITKQ